MKKILFRIIWLKEVGINNRYVQEYERGIEVACLPKENPKEPLGLADLTTAYLCHFIGFVISFCVIVAEILFSKLLKLYKGEPLRDFRVPSTKRQSWGSKVVIVKYGGKKVPPPDYKPQINFFSQKSERKPPFF